VDHLWSPWRYRYVSSDTPDSSDPAQCLFCAKAASSDDRGNLVAFRGERNFIMLNLYPYTTGHLMIVPYEHVATLEATAPATLEEMMRLTRSADRALRQIYKPDGMNLGMNLGTSAGAGVAGHIHMHVLPRWNGDAGFITTVCETRVLPEQLSVTWERLSAALKNGDTTHSA
jgi:ATP adenylyltransferase